MSTYGLADSSQFDTDGQARLIVFGVGGGGGNAVNHMINQGAKGVTFVGINTDRQALDTLATPNKLQLGKGLGAGGNPEVGREAAEGDEEDIRAFLEGYDMVFITAGMGGGTGTGAAPVVARIAKELGILTVAVVTTPFTFEGKRRIMAAKDGVEQLVQHVDSIITIPNEKLQQVHRNLTVKDAFKKADDVLLHAVNGLAQAITSEGYMNLDFQDVRTAMAARGHAMMGVGRASGENRAREATEKAIRSPLLDDLRLENAKGLIINITAADLKMDEVGEAAEVVESITDLDNANIFYGFVEDESMDDDIHITVIATGLTMDDKPKTASSASGYQSALSMSKGQPSAQVRPAAKPINIADYLQNRQQGDDE
ncbi:cell division protein FtsZ [Moraxella nasovis]|uniref:cell division protein FtsZ n=1 Tax=Moraxella nasovis TaxID=2904121 RepID=UPI001F6148EF|nr:cell division protein FtsZ [Moraxella nasovis]UNU73764.1 cell division protein FtsZ [Moraxella nasovis]